MSEKTKIGLIKEQNACQSSALNTVLLPEEQSEEQWSFQKLVHTADVDLGRKKTDEV